MKSGKYNDLGKAMDMIMPDFHSGSSLRTFAKRFQK